MGRTAIVWLRRDLRLADNPALERACAEAEQVVLVFIHAPQEEGRWAAGAASRWWLHHSLERLGASLLERGSRLLLRRGPSLEVLRQLIRETGSKLVVWSRCYEPALLERDRQVEAALSRDGIEVLVCNSALLVEPWKVRTGQGEPYRVFTPFWRKVQQELDTLPSPSAPRPRLPGPTRGGPRSEALSALGLEPAIRWDLGLAKAWRPGEAGAQARLERFCAQALAGYQQGRDRPDVEGTSRLSPHLHFGEISPCQVLATLRPLLERGTSRRAAESFLRELGWREFAHHLLFHFPHTSEQPLDERFNDLRWSRSRRALEAWQLGRTGIPLVDAGMRELWRTGWMHNRVRMIVASFLTKNLRLHWLEGASWFWDTLVDADLAANTLGWQWTAGCGADAAPYFRIFNPVLQSERFDPERVYLRRWVPELARLPDRYVHRPWEAPTAALAAAGVFLGRDYPRPMVDLKQSRAAALAGYVRIRRKVRH